MASILLPIETKGREMKDVTPAQKNKAHKRPEPPAEFENPISFDQSANWTRQNLLHSLVPNWAACELELVNKRNNHDCFSSYFLHRLWISYLTHHIPMQFLHSYFLAKVPSCLCNRFFLQFLFWPSIYAITSIKSNIFRQENLQATTKIFVHLLVLKAGSINWIKVEDFDCGSHREILSSLNKKELTSWRSWKDSWRAAYIQPMYEKDIKTLLVILFLFLLSFAANVPFDCNKTIIKSILL